MNIIDTLNEIVTKEAFNEKLKKQFQNKMEETFSL